MGKQVRKNKETTNCKKHGSDFPGKKRMGVVYTMTMVSLANDDCVPKSCRQTFGSPQCEEKSP